MLGKQIKNIQIFGERCSGTNYLERLIKTNFGVRVTSDFGFKHWFLDGISPRSRTNLTTDLEQKRSLDDSDDTLFLCLLRSPYDWLRSLYKKPHHTVLPDDLKFGEFVRMPWVSQDQVKRNAAWRKNRGEELYFIEEAQNICELRSQKIEHWLELKKIVKNVEFLKYEDLSRNPGLLIEIVSHHGISTKEDGFINVTEYKSENKRYEPTRYPRISRKDMGFINSQLNWALESTIGYEKSDWWKHFLLDFFGK